MGLELQAPQPELEADFLLSGAVLRCWRLPAAAEAEEVVVRQPAATAVPEVPAAGQAVSTARLVPSLAATLAMAPRKQRAAQVVLRKLVRTVLPVHHAKAATAALRAPAAPTRMAVAAVALHPRVAEVVAPVAVAVCMAAAAARRMTRLVMAEEVAEEEAAAALQRVVCKLRLPPQARVQQLETVPIASMPVAPAPVALAGQLVPVQQGPTALLL